MEYTQTEFFQYYKSTNRATTNEKFEDLPALLDFLHGQEEDDQILRIVREWLEKVEG